MVQPVAVPAYEAVPLRNYFEALLSQADLRYEQRFIAQEKAVAAALAAAKEAVAVAEGNAEKWRAQANEWRGAMTDRERSFPTRNETELALDSVRAQIAPLKTYVDLQTGKSVGINSGWAWLIGAVGLVVTVANLAVLWK